MNRWELEHLKVVEYNTPIFYIIPKVHKFLKDPPGRSIISAIRGPLERTGKYLDVMLKDMVISLQSYVKDTRDVLAQINEIKL